MSREKKKEIYEKLEYQLHFSCLFDFLMNFVLIFKNIQSIF